MRLNEIQKLEKHVGAQNICINDYSQREYTLSIKAIEEINKAFERLSAPTVDAVAVDAEWIDQNLKTADREYDVAYPQCSACGAWALQSGGNPCKSSHCPTCGANMRADSKKEQSKCIGCPYDFPSCMDDERECPQATGREDGKG